MTLFRRRDKTGNWFIDHSLSIVLFIILIVHQALTAWLGYPVWVSEQKAHSESASGFWSQDYMTWYGFESNVSLLAEPWGVIIIVLLSKWLYERGSSESNDREGSDNGTS